MHAHQERRVIYLLLICFSIWDMCLWTLPELWASPPISTLSICKEAAKLGCDGRQKKLQSDFEMQRFHHSKTSMNRYQCSLLPTMIGISKFYYSRAVSWDTTLYHSNSWFQFDAMLENICCTYFHFILLVLCNKLIIISIFDERNIWFIKSCSRNKLHHVLSNNALLKTKPQDCFSNHIKSTFSWHFMQKSRHGLSKSYFVMQQSLKECVHHPLYNTSTHTFTQQWRQKHNSNYLKIPSPLWACLNGFVVLPG